MAGSYRAPGSSDRQTRPPGVSRPEAPSPPAGGRAASAGRPENVEPRRPPDETGPRAPYPPPRRVAGAAGPGNRLPRSNRDRPHRPRNAAPVLRPTAPRPGCAPEPAIRDPARHRPSPAPGHRGGRGVRTRRSTAHPGSGAPGPVGRGSRPRIPCRSSRTSVNAPSGHPPPGSAASRAGKPVGMAAGPGEAGRPPRQMSARLAKPLMSDPHEAWPVRRVCAGRCSRNTPTPIPSMTRGCRRRSTSMGANSGFSANSRTR